MNMMLGKKLKDIFTIDEVTYGFDPNGNLSRITMSKCHLLDSKPVFVSLHNIVKCEAQR